MATFRCLGKSCFKVPPLHTKASAANTAHAWAGGVRRHAWACDASLAPDRAELSCSLDESVVEREAKAGEPAKGACKTSHFASRLHENQNVPLPDTEQISSLSQG